MSKLRCFQIRQDTDRVIDALFLFFSVLLSLLKLFALNLYLPRFYRLYDITEGKKYEYFNLLGLSTLFCAACKVLFLAILIRINEYLDSSVLAF
jgi:hypothetical protein